MQDAIQTPLTVVRDVEHKPQSDQLTPPPSDSESDHDDIALGARSEEGIELTKLVQNPHASESRESLYVDEYLEGDVQREVGSIRGRERKRKDDFALYTPDEERHVVRKFDRRLVLFVALLYMLSFLDRSNIGNARIAGLDRDLNLSSDQYEWLLTAFYITYIVFEWMTLLYRVFPPHIYIAVCVLSWGIIASLQSVANSFAFMLVLRAALGIGEAAFGPGVPFYLSFFFKREELALRTGLFISAAPLATSFASTLAWLITKLGEHVPIASWRLLFLIEGFPSMIVAVFVWYYIPDSPSTARYLTARERKVAVLRLRKEKGAPDGKSTSGGRRRLDWRDIGATLLDPKCYLTAAMFFSCNVAFSSLPPFLPTIIQEMGYTSLLSQALSAPPYLVSFLFVLLIAYLSDRHRSRGPYIVFCALLGASGYAGIAVAGSLRASSGWRYAGVYPAAMGFFAAITLIIAWTINNQDSDEKKGTGMAMLNVVGQLGPLVGTRLYPDSDKPFYVMGMSVCAVFMLLVAVLAWGLRLVLRRENRKRGEGYGRIGARTKDDGREVVMNIL